MASAGSRGCAAGFAPPVVEPFLARPRGEDVIAEIDRIFFAASGTQSFASEDARRAFRERWLGRYLDEDAQHAFLAVARAQPAEERVAGYLVGSLDDPANATRFDDLPYFKQLAQAIARFPAQLHVNVAEEWRGRGVGRELVEAFCRHAARAGAPGVHVFTGRGMRNARFYGSAGFKEIGTALWNGREVVMLGRRL